MSNKRFENLLEQMPKIAKVINSFESQEVQREVFITLIRALDREAYTAPRQERNVTPLDKVRSVPLHDDLTQGLDISPEIGGGSIHSFIES